MFEDFLKLLAALLIFAGVLALTYFTTRYIAKIQRTRFLGSNISVLESQQLAVNKTLYLVKIGGEYYALAGGKDTVNVIGKVDSSGLRLPEENPDTDMEASTHKESFQQVLERFKLKKQDKE